MKKLFYVLMLAVAFQACTQEEEVTPSTIANATVVKANAENARAQRFEVSFEIRDYYNPDYVLNGHYMRLSAQNVNTGASFQADDLDAACKWYSRSSL